MTKDEARELLEGNREDHQGKEPGGAMLKLQQLFARATPEERGVLNEVIREWLVSEHEADRFDGSFLTDEFRITENEDLIRKLRARADQRTDPMAAYERAKYDRVLSRLAEPRAPNFAAMDPQLNEWAARNGLQVMTQHRDEEVRSIPVVDAAGREFQIWLQPDFDGFTVHAASLDRRRRLWRSWTSDASAGADIVSLLDEALDEIHKWSANLSEPS